MLMLNNANMLRNVNPNDIADKFWDDWKEEKTKNGSLSCPGLHLAAKNYSKTIWQNFPGFFPKMFEQCEVAGCKKAARHECRIMLQAHFSMTYIIYTFGWTTILSNANAKQGKCWATLMLNNANAKQCYC